MNFDSKFGERLRETRDQLAMSQSQVAASCGVSREMWGKYERGQAVPGADVLAGLAALGADIRYILTGDETIYESEPIASTLTVREADLLDNYRQASEAGRKALEQTSAALAQPKDVKKSA